MAYLHSVVCHYGIHCGIMIGHNQCRTAHPLCLMCQEVASLGVSIVCNNNACMPWHQGCSSRAVYGIIMLVRKGKVDGCIFCIMQYIYPCGRQNQRMVVYETSEASIHFQQKCLTSGHRSASMEHLKNLCCLGPRCSTHVQYLQHTGS